MAANWHQHPTTSQSPATGQIFKQEACSAMLHGDNTSHTTRNDWIFNQVDPTVDNCVNKFFSELRMVNHRAKSRHIKIVARMDTKLG
ncbi:hypothetical protein EJB05_49711, partial [Eragrostis curvula]